MTTVLHQPRIAWDTAMQLIRAAEDGDAVYAWSHERIEELLGSAYTQSLDATRAHLTEPFVPPGVRDIQAATWRVRLEDELRTQPHLAPQLARFAVELRGRLAN